MVNFKPGEYMRKMFYSVNDSGDSEKNPSYCAYYKIAKFTALRCVFLGESEIGFVISDHMDSSPPKKRKIPKKDQLL